MSNMATRSYHARKAAGNVQSVGYRAVDGVAKTGFRASAVFSSAYSYDAERRQNPRYRLYQSSYMIRIKTYATFIAEIQ